MTGPEQQFSPDQILAAAQRAEGDGRVDYAIEFYRHLATYFPGHAAADEARFALTRLGGAAQDRVELPTLERFGWRADPSSEAEDRGQWASEPWAGNVAQPSVAGWDRAADAEPQRGTEATSLDLDEDDEPTVTLARRLAREAHSEATGAVGPRARGGAASTPATAPQPPGHAGGTPVPAADSRGRETGRGRSRTADLPRPRRRFRIGRFIAGVLTVIGVVGFLIASGLAVAAAIQVAGLADLRIGLQPHVVLAFAPYSAGVSLMLVLFGQMALAVFAAANAAEDVARVQRALGDVPDDDAD